MSLRILHLSDLHLCGDKAPNVDDVLFNVSITPDTIMVTGDIFDAKAFSIDKGGKRGNAYQKRINHNLNAGVKFFDDLIESINTNLGGSLTKQSVLFIPGNHEVQREANNISDAFQIYFRFLEMFYVTLPDWYSEDMTFIRILEDKNVIIIGFRSPHVYTNKHSLADYDDYSIVDSTQLLSIRRKLRKIRDYSNYFVIAALHHQFFLMEERNKSYVDKSYVRNCEQFVDFLNTSNISLVLHGHKHTKFNRRLNVEQDISKPEKIITVLGCGSLDENDQTNSFNIITVYPKGYRYEIEYASYIRENTCYSRESILKLPVFNDHRNSLLLIESIHDYPELHEKYNNLIEYDRYTNIDDIFEVLNKTVLSLPEVVNHIHNMPDLLYFILATVHYSTVLNNKEALRIRGTIDSFIEDKKRQYFLDDTIYDELMNISDLKTLEKAYLKYIGNLNNDQRKIVVFSTAIKLILIFYHIIKNEPVRFYEETVGKKITFAYPSNNLINEIRGNSVDFSIDDEKRLLEVAVSCDTAEAVKICSLIIKEFEIILQVFEREFSNYGFRIYYTLPKLKYYGREKNGLESRQFTAYIPKLLPLLAGRNIYSKPESFAREVIQNSIDAINVRKECDRDFLEEGLIKIEINNTKGRPSYFKITDNGSGMTKYILERYLTTLGLSYYGGSDYDSLKINYNPISQFGIGFLSCFMYGNHVEVHTRHYTSEKGYYLDIPNYDGCFFIEESLESYPIGTTVTIWERLEDESTNYSISSIDVEKYICQYIKHASIDIKVNNRTIPKNGMNRHISLKTEKYGIMHYISLIKNTELGKWCALEISDEDQIDRYGIWFYKPDNKIYSFNRNNDEDCILNDGIWVPTITGNREIFNRMDESYYVIAANFPPEVLNLDVSRDKLIGFKEIIDWKSIENAFLKTRKSFIGYNVPLFILQNYYNHDGNNRFENENFVFKFDPSNKSITIRFEKCTGPRSFSKDIINLISYISGGYFDEEIAEGFNTLRRDTQIFSSQEGYISNLHFNIFEIVFELMSVFRYLNKSKYDSPIDNATPLTNILLGQEDSASKLIQQTTKKMYQYLSKHDRNTIEKKEFYSFLRENIMESSGEYYDIFNNRRRKIAEYYLKKEESSAETVDIPRKMRTFESILDNIKTSNTIADALRLYFHEYLHFSYQSRSYKFSMLDVVATTIAAIYDIFDICCVACSYDQWLKGIEFKIGRNDLLPNVSWWNGFSK